MSCVRLCRLTPPPHISSMSTATLASFGNERADRLANQGRLQHPGRLQFLWDRRERHGLAPVVLAAYWTLLLFVQSVCLLLFLSSLLVGWMASSD